MSEVEAEVGWAPESSAQGESEDVGGYGWAADGGEQAWSGPSPDEWAATQQTIAQQQEYIAAIAQLLGGEEEQQPGFDPFAEDGGRAQLDAIIAEHTAPIEATFQQIQEQAALAEGEAEASRVIADTAAQLGVTVDEAAVRRQANDDVVGLASQLMANAGYLPAQVKAFLDSGPLAAFDLLAQAYGKTRQDVARAALQTRIASNHGESTRPRGPSGVLAKYTRQQPLRQSRAGRMSREDAALTAAMVRRVKGGR